MNTINTAAILLVVSAAFTLQAETIPTRQMYASSGNDLSVLVPASNPAPKPTSVTFSPTEDNLVVTHLGLKDATGQGFDRALIVALIDNTGTSQRAAAVTFDANVQGFLRDGFRFLRLDRPVALNKGQNYRLATPDNAAYARDVSLLFATTAGSQNITAMAVPPLTMETPFLTTGGLNGEGTLTVSRQGDIALIESKVADGQKAIFNGSLVSGEGDRVGFIKSGPGSQHLWGDHSFTDGVYVENGYLYIPGVSSIGETADLYFGQWANSDEGVLKFAEGTHLVSNRLFAGRLNKTGLTKLGIEAGEGASITIHDTVIRAWNKEVNRGGSGPGLVFRAPAYASATEERQPQITVRDVKVDYIDLYARVDGVDTKTAYANRIVFDRLQPVTTLRKFTVLSADGDKLAGTVELTGGNTVAADYFDIAGWHPRFILKGATTLDAGHVRFAHSAQDYVSSSFNSNPEITIAENARLIANGIPTSATSTGVKITLDGAVLQLRDKDAEDYFSVQNTEVILGEAGVTFELVDPKNVNHQLGLTRSMSGSGSVTIRGTDKDAAVATMSAAMSYTGATVVEGAKLVLKNTLASGSDLTLAEGAALELVKPEDVESLSVEIGKLTVSDPATVVTVGEGVELIVGAFEGDFIKRGAGSLVLAALASETSALAGTIKAEAGALGIAPERCAMALTPELITDGSFEPKTPLPTNNRGNQDKRSTRDAAWFTTNLPGWTFGPDNNGSGICNNGSYFTNNSQLPDGKHCAFLRKVISNGNVSAGPGIVSQKVTTTKPNAIMKLRFRFNARWYDDPSWGRKAGWAARVGVQLDGSEVFASETIHSTNDNAGYKNWTVCEVLLPIAEAGEHTLAFTALDPQWEGETDSEVLLDDVKTAIAYLASGDAYANLVLDLAQGTTLDLSSSVQGYKIKNVFYNGEKIHGTISAATHPAFVTGSGKLKAGSGLVVFVR